LQEKNSKESLKLIHKSAQFGSRIIPFPRSHRPKLFISIRQDFDRLLRSFGCIGTFIVISNRSFSPAERKLSPIAKRYSYRFEPESDAISPGLPCESTLRVRKLINGDEKLINRAGFDV
jgi:hypothetical protein